MAARIDMTTGQAGIAYVGETPWHGLGQELQKGASIDQWRVAAGMNWEAKKVPELYNFHNLETGKTELKASSEFLIIRSDTGAKLGNATDRYKFVQPKDTLEFYRDLCEIHGFELNTAGCLDDGARIWAQATIPGGFSIMGQDTILPRLLLATSFDGSLATTAQFCAERVVCHNTISIALAEKTKAVKVSHSTTFDATKVKVELGLMEESFKLFETQANQLARRTIKRNEAEKYFFNLFRDKDEHTVQDLSTRKVNIINNVANLYFNGIGQNLRAANETAWGLVNAVTQFVDWEQGNNANNRFKNAHFGKGDDFKSFAFEQALKLAA